MKSLISKVNSYDKPSPKLFAFLKKHYGLQSYNQQNNNFVVFNAYWDANLAKNTKKNDEQVEYSRPFKNTTNQQVNKETPTLHRRNPSYLTRNDTNDSDTSDYFYRRQKQDSQKNLTLSTYERTTKPSENMVKPSSPVKRGGNNPLKMTKEEENLMDIKYKNQLSIKDERVKQAKDKVVELDQKFSNPIQQKRNRDYYGTAPWGTEDTSDNYTTSNNYGRHYNYRK